MRTPGPVTDANFMAIARPLVPLIESTVRKFQTLVAVNRAIHADLYKSLVAEAAGIAQQ
jgi:hypothetical protein